MVIRRLVRDPTFTLTATAVLAIGIGANSTMFSIVRSVLLRPVPWHQPDRLAVVMEAQRDSGDLTNPSTARIQFALGCCGRVADLLDFSASAAVVFDVVSRLSLKGLWISLSEFESLSRESEDFDLGSALDR